MVKKSMLFLHTFFDVISLVENSLDMLAPFVFEVLISMDKKSMSYFFRCNFFRRKIHVVSTYFLDVISMIEISTFFPYFFRCDFSGREIHVVSTYLFRRHFDGRKIHVVCTWFFRGNFDGQKFDAAFGKLQANESIRGGVPLLVTLKS